MAEDYVIPPGQEEILGAMLGKDGGLPGDCHLTTGDVEKTVVKATYACPGGEVVVELAHPAAAAENATRTEKFAVRIDRGTPPPDFQGALLARIRQRETEFRWTAQPRGPLVGQPRTVSISAAALVLVPLLLAAWLFWRRRRRARPG